MQGCTIDCRRPDERRFTTVFTQRAGLLPFDLAMLKRKVLPEVYEQIEPSISI